MKEIATLNGLAAVDTARNVADVNRAASQVTWNENLMAADDRGNIGYWHPGLLPGAGQLIRGGEPNSEHVFDLRPHDVRAGRRTRAVAGTVEL